MGEAFAAFVLSGRAIDVALGFILLEWVVLRFFVGKRPGGRLALVLAPGAFLMLAVRSALMDAPAALAACLLLALAAHIVDLRVRPI